ncbi:hypothetical protein FF2_045943 [Malus domestica]
MEVTLESRARERSFGKVVNANDGDEELALFLEMAQQQRPRLPPEIRRISRELPHRPPGRAGVTRRAGYVQCAPSRLVVLIFSI